MWSIQSLHQWNTIVARWNTLLWYLFSTCQRRMIGMRHLLDNTNLEQGNEGCPANRAIRGLISQAPKICTIGNCSFFPCQLYVLTLHTDSTSTNADTVVLWYLLSHLKMTANFTNLFPIHMKNYLHMQTTQSAPQSSISSSSLFGVSTLFSKP